MYNVLKVEEIEYFEVVLLVAHFNLLVSSGRKDKSWDIEMHPLM